METLVIHVPEKKSALVKQILRGLGVNIDAATATLNKKSAHDFLGLTSKTDAILIDKAIADGCEQINPDDWK
jgi:hypothetical protein